MILLAYLLFLGEEKVNKFGPGGAYPTIPPCPGPPLSLNSGLLRKNSIKSGPGAPRTTSLHLISVQSLHQTKDHLLIDSKTKRSLAVSVRWVSEKRERLRGRPSTY